MNRDWRPELAAAMASTRLEQREEATGWPVRALAQCMGHKNAATVGNMLRRVGIAVDSRNGWGSMAVCDQAAKAFMADPCAVMPVAAARSGRQRTDHDRAYLALVSDRVREAAEACGWTQALTKAVLRVCTLSIVESGEDLPMRRLPADVLLTLVEAVRGRRVGPLLLAETLAMEARDPEAAVAAMDRALRGDAKARAKVIDFQAALAARDGKGAA